MTDAVEYELPIWQRAHVITNEFAEPIQNIDNTLEETCVQLENNLQRSQPEHPNIVLTAQSTDEDFSDENEEDRVEIEKEEIKWKDQLMHVMGKTCLLLIPAACLTSAVVLAIIQRIKFDHGL